MNVLHGRSQIGVITQERVPKPTFEEMADSSVSSVEALGVHSFDVAKRLAQLPGVVLDDEVNMIRHEAEGMKLSCEPVASISNKSKKRRPISVIKEDRLSIVSPRGHVMEATGWMNPEGSRHSSTIRTPCDNQEQQPDGDGT